VCPCVSVCMLLLLSLYIHCLDMHTLFLSHPHVCVCVFVVCASYPPPRVLRVISSAEIIHTYIDVCVCAYVYFLLLLHILCLDTNTHTHTHTHTHMCVCVCVCFVPFSASHLSPKSCMHKSVCACERDCVCMRVCM